MPRVANSQDICSPEQFTRFKEICDNLNWFVVDAPFVSEADRSRLRAELEEFWPVIEQMAKHLEIALDSQLETALSICDLPEIRPPYYDYSDVRMAPIDVKDHVALCVEQEQTRYQSQTSARDELLRKLLDIRAAWLQSYIDDIITVDSSQFSHGITWMLLEDIVNDSRREGVPLKNKRTLRTLRTLKERLKAAAQRLGKDEYKKLADSLQYTNGRAYTDIEAGRIIIL